VLLTDGINNAAGDPVEAARQLGVVVHSVGVGNSLRGSSSYRDIQVTGFEITLWSGPQTINVGVYADNGSNYPGNLVYTSGPQVIPEVGTGTQTQSVMVDPSHYVLCAGTYWIAMSGDGNASDHNTVNINASVTGYYAINSNIPAVFPSGAGNITMPVMQIDYCY